MERKVSREMVVHKRHSKSTSSSQLSNNEGKPITNSRDCQEVLYEQGVDTMKLILEYASTTCMLDDLEHSDLNEEMKRIAKKVSVDWAD